MALIFRIKIKKKQRRWVGREGEAFSSSGYFSFWSCHQVLASVAFRSYSVRSSNCRWLGGLPFCSYCSLKGDLVWEKQESSLTASPSIKIGVLIEINFLKSANGWFQQMILKYFRVLQIKERIESKSLKHTNMFTGGVFSKHRVHDTMKWLEGSNYNQVKFNKDNSL